MWLQPRICPLHRHILVTKVCQEEITANMPTQTCCWFI